MYLEYAGAGAFEIGRDNGDRIILEEYEVDEIIDYFSDIPYYGERLKRKTKLASVDVIFKRLKRAIYYEAGKIVTTDKELAEYMDIKPSHLCRCKKNGTIPYEHIAFICLDLRINMSELIAG